MVEKAARLTISEWYTAGGGSKSDFWCQVHADITGKQVPVLANLQPATIRGVESNGMILCADSGAPIILSPLEEVANGSKVK